MTASARQYKTRALSSNKLYVAITSRNKAVWKWRNSWKSGVNLRSRALTQNHLTRETEMHWPPMLSTQYKSTKAATIKCCIIKCSGTDEHACRTA